MKVYRILFPAILGILISCEKSENSDEDILASLTELKGESGLSYDESLANWNSLKNVNGNSYIYQTTFVSWTGFGSVTELKIEEGSITSRVYQEFNTDESTGQREIVDSYTETKSNLGSHEKGANLFTIDDLYNSCASHYLIVNAEDNTLYFETESDGLMTLCGFVPNGCMDDCFTGVQISSFMWID